MTEEEMETGQETAIIPEVVEKPKVQTSKDLMLFMHESELEQEKQQFLINKYAEHFEMAAVWAKKASKIIVTNKNQTVLMEEAKTARLFLRKKRLEIENSRKMLKAGALKECQVIDRVANFLKNVIEPSEEHLDRQEHFIEYNKKAEDERLLAEARAKEEARLAEEARLKAEENARLQAENARLQAEAREKEKELALERAEVARKEAKIKAEQEAVLDAERKKQAAILAEERAKAVAAEKALQEKISAELKVEADKIRAAEELLKADDSIKMLAFKNAVKAIQIPEVKSAINKQILADAKSHLWLAISKITI